MKRNFIWMSFGSNILIFVYLLLSLNTLYMDLDSVFAFNENARAISGVSVNISYITLNTANDKILIDNTPLQIVLIALIVNAVELIGNWAYLEIKERKGK